MVEPLHLVIRSVAQVPSLQPRLIYEMERRKSKYGMVTMCIGGGMGAAAIFENLQ